MHVGHNITNVQNSRVERLDLGLQLECPVSRWNQIQRWTTHVARTSSGWLFPLHLSIESKFKTNGFERWDVLLCLAIENVGTRTTVTEHF